MASKQIAHEMTPTHFINTIEWNGMPDICSYGNLETSYREIRERQVVPDSFVLIQHSWRSWQEAHAFIKKALAKGWSERRIADAMYFLKERGRK